MICQEDCGLFNPICEDECYEIYQDNLTNCPCSEKCYDGCPCPSTSTYDCSVPITSAPSTLTTQTVPPNVDIAPGQLSINYPQIHGECYSYLWDPPSPGSNTTRINTSHNYITHYIYGKVSEHFVYFDKLLLRRIPEISHNLCAISHVKDDFMWPIL